MTTYFVDLPPSQFALSAAAPDPGGTGILTAGGKFGIQAYTDGGEAVYAKSTASNGVGVLGIHDDGGQVQTDENGARIFKGYAVRGLKLSKFPGAAIFGEAVAGEGVRAISHTASAIHASNNGNWPTVNVENGARDNSEAILAWRANGTGCAIKAVNLGNGTGIFASGKPWAGEFNGNVRVSGNLQVGGTITHAGADYAEDFEVAPGLRAVKPGTVMILDEQGRLRPSAEPCDTRVIGVVSGAGDYRPAIVLDRHEGVEDRLPIALLGKAFCLADADQAPIAAGDLLTSSPNAGHAMRVARSSECAGAIIGKALAPLTKGQGLIPVLVGLH